MINDLRTAELAAQNARTILGAMPERTHDRLQLEMRLVVLEMHVLQLRAKESVRLKLASTVRA